MPKETIGYIQSAGCHGQRDVVIATCNAPWPLLQEVNVHQAGKHVPRVPEGHNPRPVEHKSESVAQRRVRDLKRPNVRAKET